MTRKVLLLILASYGALAAVVQVHCADSLTSDGECYLRMAGHYARGEFQRAIFLNWSPLPSLMTVPLVWLGIEPRVAFRVMLGLWGAMAVVGVWRLAGRLGECGVRSAECGAESEIGNRKSQMPPAGPWLRALATGCAALMAAEFAAGQWVDLLLTALLLFYLDASMDDRLMASWRWALWVGVLAGFAYLGKNYARPFFLAHFPLLVVARTLWWRPATPQPRAAVPHTGPERRWLRALGTWAAGVAGFALVALPWAAVLSVRFGRVTFGTSVGQAYAKLGALDEDARKRAITGLRKPPADAPSVWQDSSRPPPPAPGLVRALAAGGWPGLARQAEATARNAWGILRRLFRMDPLHVGGIALALVALGAVVARRTEGGFRYGMLTLALAVFCGGYALVYAGEQRYFWFVFLIAAVAAFHFAGVLPRRLGRPREARLAVAALALLATVSFGGRSAGYLADLLRRPPLGREHRLAAEWLRAKGLGGPLAAAGERAWWNGLHVAFFLDAQYAGTPAATDPSGIVAEMRAAGAPTLLVWRDPPLAATLRANSELQFVGTIPALGAAEEVGGVVVLRLPPEAGPPTGGVKSSFFNYRLDARLAARDN